MVKLILDGKEYAPIKPKAYVWRACMEWEEKKQAADVKNFLLGHCECLSLIYGVPAEEIEEKADIEDILAVYHQAFTWVTSLIGSKLADIVADPAKNS